MKWEIGAANLHEGFPSPRPPVAMRTFVGKVMQPGMDHFARNSTVDAQLYNYSRFGAPLGGLYALGSGSFLQYACFR